MLAEACGREGTRLTDSRSRARAEQTGFRPARATVDLRRLRRRRTASGRPRSSRTIF
jgi:hypothetical protein